MKVQPHRSSIGMDANIWAMLIYIITVILSWIPVVQYIAWLFPLAIYLVEKSSGFIRFHAIQAVAIYAVGAIVFIILNIISAIIAASLVFSAATNPLGIFGAGYGALGGVVAVSVIGGVINLLLMILAILALIQAYQYEEYKVPVLGSLADKLASIGKK